MRRRLLTAMPFGPLLLVSATLPASLAFAVADPPDGAQSQGVPAGAFDDIFLDSVGDEAVVGDFHSIETGLLTGPDDVGALLLAGDGAHAVVGLGRFAHSVALAEGATSGTLLSTAALGIPGLPDLILVSTGLGLERFIWDGIEGQFLPLPPVDPQGMLTKVPAMVGARLDDAGLGDLVTASPTAAGFLDLWRLDLTGTPFSVTTIKSPTLVLELGAIDWDGDGLDEIVVRGVDGVVVLRNDGKMLASWDFDGAAAAIETLRSNAFQPNDRLAIARPGPEGGQELLIVGEGYASIPVPLEFSVVGEGEGTAVDVVGLTAGDSDGDGDLDLLVSQRTFQAGFVVENTGLQEPAFLSESWAYGVVDYSTTPHLPVVGALPAAAFTDIDVAGDADVLAPFDAFRSIVVVTAEDAGLAGSGGQSFIGGGGLGDSLLHHEQMDHASGAWQYPYRLFLDIPGSVPIAAFNAIQVQVWNQPASSPVSSVGLVNEFYRFPDPATGPTQSIEDWRHLGVDVDWNEPLAAQWTEGRNLYLTYRLVRLAPGPGIQLEEAGRWFISAMTLTPDVANWQNLTYQQALRSSVYFIAGRDILDLVPLGGGGVTGITLGISADVGRIGNLAGAPLPPLPVVEQPTKIFYWDPNAAE